MPAHSPLLDPIVKEFGDYLAGLKFSAPKRPFMSNLTGAFVTDKDLSAAYFVRHLRETVSFADGLAALFQAHPQAVLVEVGPGQTLSSVARLHSARRPEHAIVPLAPHVKDPTSHARWLKASAGRIFPHGGKVDLQLFTNRRDRRVVPLHGVYNFRDIGGYPALGGVTRWESVYRADGLSRLTTDDLDVLRDRGLAVVIDLRTEAEIDERGRFPVDQHAVRFHHLPVLDRTWLPGDMPDFDNAADFLLWAYHDMIKVGSDKLAAGLTLIAESGSVSVLRTKAPYSAIASGAASLE